MKIKMLALLLFLGISLPGPSFGQGSATVTILGAGGSPCAKYLSDSASSPAFASVYLNWAMGYFTAVNLSNATKPGSRSIQNPNGVEAALQRFCQANPEKNFSDAVLSYVILTSR